MCASSGWTFLLAPWSSEVSHAALIPTVMPLSWGAVAPSGPPRCSLWPPRRCALHLSCGRGPRKRPVVQSGSHDLCRTRGREKLIKWLGITTFCVQQDFSCTPFTPAGFWGRFNIGCAWRPRGALYYFSNAAATKKTKNPKPFYVSEESRGGGKASATTYEFSKDNAKRSSSLSFSPASCMC